MRSFGAALVACCLVASAWAEALDATRLQHTTLTRDAIQGGRGRQLIEEAGPNANTSTTVGCTSGYCLGNVAVNLPWGSPNTSYPTNGTAWGVSISGPSGYALASDMVLEQLPNYIITWYTRAPVIGPPTSQAFNTTPDGTLQRCPNNTMLYLSNTTTNLTHPNNTVWGALPDTYARVYLKSSGLENLSYASPCIRHVVLYDLNPNTLYYYAIPSDNKTDNTTKPRVFSFWTLPISNATNWTLIDPPLGTPGNPYVNFTQYPITLGLVGDLGQTYNSTETRDRILAADPDVLLIPGDISYADDVAVASPPNTTATGKGANQQLWDSAAVLMESLFSRIPTLTAAGNHEIESDAINATLNSTTEYFDYPENYPFQAFAARWPSPGVPEDQFGDIDFGNIDNNLYYSTVIGGVVKLIVMNNYVPFHEGTDQYWWALEEFANTDRTVTPWLMVMFHAPLYHNYVSHYKEATCFFSVWEDIFYEYGVDLVINGHTHAYERTHPVYKYEVDTCAPVYITIGDGGNAEGLSRTFVDELDPTTGKTYCEGFSTSNTTLWLPDYQAQVQTPSCPTVTFEPSYSVKGGPVLNSSPLNASLGFCQSSQPLWSAFRDPAFGFGTLTLLNETTANLNWFSNEVAPATPTDSITLVTTWQECTMDSRRRVMRELRSAMPKRRSASRRSRSRNLGSTRRNAARRAAARRSTSRKMK